MKKGYFHQKLETLNKGLKGDWQKEGHSFSHFFENDSEPGFKVLQIESHKDGNRSGFWRFSYIPHQKDDKRSKYTNHTVDDAYTYPEHQRKGLATHAYSLSEKILGSKVDSMEGARSKEADGLWSQPNRNFGKSENKIIKGENMDTPKPVVTPVEETPSQKYFKDKIKQIKDKFNAEQETKAGETWKNNIKAAGVDARAKMSKNEPPKEPPTLNYATMENSSYKPWHWKEKLAASKRNAGTPKTAVPATAPAPLATTPKPRSFRDYANGIKKSQLEKEEMTNKLKGGKADGKDKKI